MVAGQATSLNEKVIAGPFSLFSDSFVLEFLEPHPSRNATVLMRTTYKHDHPLCKQGKSHPQAPPLHLHFDQSENFQVLSGKVGTTSEFGAIDRVWTPKDGPQHIAPWVPHQFWPCVDAEEDTTILVWAHPDNVPQPMDWLFFQNLLMIVSDVSEKKASMNPLQIMLTQHESATALVWFPQAWYLGPLRWWIPWQIQGGFAFVAKLLGYKGLVEKYTPEEEWAEYIKLKAK